jgi:hypothetical protein
MRILDLRLNEQAPDYLLSLDPGNHETHLLLQPANAAAQDNGHLLVLTENAPLQAEKRPGNLVRIKPQGTRELRFKNTSSKKEIRYKLYVGNWAEIWLAELYLRPNAFLQTDLSKHKIQFLLGDPQKSHVSIEDNDPHTYKLSAYWSNGQKRSAVFFKGGEEVRLIKLLYRNIRLNARRKSFREEQKKHADELERNIHSLMQE